MTKTERRHPGASIYLKEKEFSRRVPKPLPKHKGTQKRRDPVRIGKGSHAAKGLKSGRTPERDWVKELL